MDRIKALQVFDWVLFTDIFPVAIAAHNAVKVNNQNEFRHVCVCVCRVFRRTLYYSIEWMAMSKAMVCDLKT